MLETLKRLLSPEYLIVADPGPMGGLWLLYLLLGLFFGAVLAASLWVLAGPRRHSQPSSRKAWAWFTLWVCLAGAGTVLGRFLAWPGWSARIWPYSLLALALAGTLAYVLRQVSPPAWLARQGQILAFGSLAPLSRPGGRGARLALVAGLLLHLAGIGLVARVRYGWPLWTAPLLLLALLLPGLPSLARRSSEPGLDRPRGLLGLEMMALTPLLAAYAVTLLWLAYRWLGITITGWQGLAFPDPMTSLFYVDGIVLAAVAYTVLCQLHVTAQAFARPGLLWRGAVAGLLVATLAWTATVYFGKRTHGATASDPYAYVQMGVDLAERGTFVHRFSLFEEVIPLGIAWAPLQPVGYHIPRNDLGDCPSVWATGASAILAAGYKLLGEAGLYVTTPILALLSLVATWALVHEVLRAAPRGIRALTATLAVALLATSPEHVDRLLVPMADAPAQLFTVLTLLFLLRGARHLARGRLPLPGSAPTTTLALEARDTSLRVHPWRTLATQTARNVIARSERRLRATKQSPKLTKVGIATASTRGGASMPKSGASRKDAFLEAAPPLGDQAIPNVHQVGDCHREYSWRCFGPKDGPRNDVPFLGSAADWLLAGFCFALAYWVRHTQLVLVLAAPVAIWALGHRADPRRRAPEEAHDPPGPQPSTLSRLAVALSLALFATAALLGALPDIVYRWRWFGGPLTTETTELHLMGLQHIGPVAWEMLRAALAAGEWGYLFPLALFGAYRLAREWPRKALVLASAFLAVLLVHLAYHSLRLRDLLSLFPLLDLAVAYGAVSLLRQASSLARGARGARWPVRLGRVLLPSAAAAWIILSLAVARWAMIDNLWKPGWASFGYMRAEQRAAFDRLAELTPPDAIVGASLNAGAVALYAQRDPVRPYDSWTTEEWSSFLHAMDDLGRPVYLLDDGGLMARFIEAQRGQCTLEPVAELQVPLFYTRDRETGWLYHLTSCTGKAGEVAPEGLPAGVPPSGGARTNG